MDKKMGDDRPWPVKQTVRIGGKGKQSQYIFCKKGWRHILRESEKPDCLHKGKPDKQNKANGYQHDQGITMLSQRNFLFVLFLCISHVVKNKDRFV
jgi:hypothetical protein